MTVKQILEEHILKVIAGSIGTLSVIIGTAFTIDARYVHAADLQQFKLSQDKQFRQQSLESQVTVNELRKQMLEDKIFEIQLIPPQKRTDADRARLDKYMRDLDNITKKNADIIRNGTN